MPFLGFGTAECDEALETLQIFMLVWKDRRSLERSCKDKVNLSVAFSKLELKAVTTAPLTGLNSGCRGSIQSDGFVWFCWLFRGNFWRWIWQSPSHHYLLYVQNLRVHPGSLGGLNRHSQQLSWIQLKNKADIKPT